MTLPRDRKHKLRAPLLGVLMVAVLAACSKPVEPPPPPEPKVDGTRIVFPDDSQQLATLTTTVVKPRDNEYRNLSGRLVWNEDRTVRLMPAFTGRVSEILVKPGDTVTRGQTLARIASPDFGQVQSDAMSARSSYNLAKANLDRTRELVDHGVLARKEFETARAEFERADVEFKRTQARQNLYAKSAGVDQKLNLNTPIAGVVVERNINPGQELRSDQPLPNNRLGVFVITDPTSLWVSLDAQERDLVALHVGDRILVRVQALSDEAFPATIQHVSDSLDPDSRTIKVRAELDNAERKLKAEMFVVAQATFKVDHELDLPSSAVFLEGAQQYVFVEEAKGRYVRKAVKVRPEADAHVEVLDGLSVGERVVTSGSLLLQRILQSASKPAPVATGK